MRSRNLCIFNFAIYRSLLPNAGARSPKMLVIANS